MKRATRAATAAAKAARRRMAHPGLPLRKMAAPDDNHSDRLSNLVFLCATRDFRTPAQALAVVLTDNDQAE